MKNVYFVSNQKLIWIHEGIQSCSLQDVLDYFWDKDEVQVDTETEGFFDHSNKIICLQLGDENAQFVIDFRYISETEKNLISDRILNDPNKLKILHNAKFDIAFIWFHGMKICSIYDTMLAEIILNAGRDKPDGYYTLGQTCKRYCDVELDKSIRGIIHREGLSTRVINYAAEDVEHLSKIKNAQLPQLIELGLAKEDTQDIYTVLGLENNAVLAFAEIEYNGLKLDRAKWKEVKRLVNEEEQQVLKALDKEVIGNPKLTRFWTNYQDLFTSSEPRVTVNWSSPAQKLKVLNSVGSFETTAMRELEKQKRDYPLVDLLIKYNKINKLKTAFADKLESFINPVTGNIHTNFWQILDTGRVSCNQPNLQQVPARTYLGSKMRECFIVEEGYKMVGGDYAGAELRIIAELSEDPVWLDAFLSNKDLHSELCVLTFGIPIEDVKKPSSFKPDLKYRDIQKTISFGLSYGMSKFKLADTIEISVDDADSIINKFFKAVPKVKQFLDIIGRAGVRNGRIRTSQPYGRIRWFDDYRSDDKKILGGIERQAKNSPIQGTSADLTKLALVQIYKYVQEHNLPVALVHTVHDEIQCKVKEEYAEEWIIEMNRIMEEAGKVVVKSIPMAVDCKISDSWSK